MNIVAILAVYNEEIYLRTCLEHLTRQGIQVYVIDNSSTDSSRDIVSSFIDQGVIGMEVFPRNGVFEWVPLLRRKEELALELKADWYIHHDADEIRQAPMSYRTLAEGIEAVDKAGYNAINFDEFVFLPTSDDVFFEGTDYVDKMLYYYFFEPGQLRRVNAWKNKGQAVDLVTSGGHRAEFDGSKTYPENFILRHYIVLSLAQAIAKYGRERVYSREEVEKRGWHGSRANVDIEAIHFPTVGELKQVMDGHWDKSSPWKKHTFLAEKVSSEKMRYQVQKYLLSIYRKIKNAKG